MWKWILFCLAMLLLESVVVGATTAIFAGSDDVSLPTEIFWRSVVFLIAKTAVETWLRFAVLLPFFSGRLSWRLRLSLSSIVGTAFGLYVYIGDMASLPDSYTDVVFYIGSVLGSLTACGLLFVVPDRFSPKVIAREHN